MYCVRSYGCDIVISNWMIVINSRWMNIIIDVDKYIVGWFI